METTKILLVDDDDVLRFSLAKVHGQPLPTGCEFDTKLMPNPVRNTDFNRLFRPLSHLECATVWFDPTTVEVIALCANR